MRRLVLAIAALSCTFPVAANGDGLPLVDYGMRPDAIETRRGKVVAIPAGEKTLVAYFRRDYQARNGRVLDGRLAVPAVAYDGTPGGLSADGERLALIEPRVRFPRKDTRFVLLDRLLRPVDEIRLDGDFSFDAISPDGSALFLVEYLDRKDPSVYRVRVYDVAAGRLVGKPLIDSETAAIAMRGLPMTRATVGPREFTLYDGNGKPFVHALDTAQRSALCIPLPRETRVAPHTLRLDPSAGGLAVRGRGDQTLSWVNTDRNVALPGFAEIVATLRGSTGSDRAPRV
jgi:hypothetical protein